MSCALPPIAALDGKLLEWLDQFVCPTERQFIDLASDAQSADFFLGELLRKGTTTAMAFATVHPVSVDTFFEAAQKHRLRDDLR